jgi:hypothetical protein
MMNEKTARVVLFYLVFIIAMVILGIVLSVVLGPSMISS